MIYLLDTNTCIQYLNGRSSFVIEKFKQKKPTDIAVCDIVKSELFYGAYKSQRKKENLQVVHDFLDEFVSLPFDGKAALKTGQIRAELAIKGTPIGAYDLQIAAIALVHDLILITHNIKEFSRVEGLRYEDWEVS